MTAALYDEVDTVTAAPTLRVVRDQAPVEMPAPMMVLRREHHYGDPLVDGAAKLISIPLRHVYAALLRMGVLEVQG
jgi:hypothetical protein